MATAQGQSSRVLPNLYISDYRTARNADYLAELGISVIINVAEELPPTAASTLPNIEMFFIPFEDSMDEQLFPEIDKIRLIVDESLSKGKKVLVHCNAGRSRSAAVLLYILMTLRGMSLGNAFEILKSARQSVQPNPNFIKQLWMWQKQRAPGIEDPDFRYTRYLAHCALSYINPDSEEGEMIMKTPWDDSPKSIDALESIIDKLQLFY